jgi:RNA polymerase sigma-70 factor (ECF subfamily)
VENEEGECTCLAETLAAEDASPFEMAMRTEARLRVEAALQLLPDAYREVVVLREIEGFGYEEIAEILNVNLGTVKSRLTRGRAALRECLKNKELERATQAGSTGLTGKLEAVI